jgi:hypothetical protein
MAATYEPIASTTLGADTADVEFTSLSSAYTDMVVIVAATSTTDTAYVMRVNGDTATNYSHTILYGTGSAAGSTRSANINYVYGTYYADLSATTPAISMIQVMSYANANVYKTILVGAAANGGTSNKGVDRIVGLWRSTSAITSMKFSAASGSFKSGSTFSLYGIKAA